MQATVSVFDAADGSGRVLLDTGEEISFGPEAFTRSGLRLLRAGQRVRLRLTDGPGRVIDAVTISTLSFDD